MGVGAGYNLEVKDLKLDFDGIKLKRSEDSHGPRIDFTVPIKKERYEFEAEHPYWGLESTALMSGSVKGVIREDDCDVFSLEGNLNVFSDDNEVKDLIKDDAEGHGLSIENVFSGGYCWCTPQRNWGFETSNKFDGVIQTGENSISYTSADVDSQEMAAKVDFVHEHQDEENFYEDYEEYLDEEWTFNEPDNIDIENRIYLKDRDAVVELNLVPEWTNNTWSTRDEIEQWNNGSHEDAGFHWNDEKGMFETDSSNYNWWKELADERHKCFDHFRDEGQVVGSKEESESYMAFRNWLEENNYISDKDLETEKHMSEYIPEYESFLKEKQKDEIADEISSVLNKMDGNKNKTADKDKSRSAGIEM